MSVELLDLSYGKQWDQFVMSHEEGSFYDLCGWLSALQDTYGFKVRLAVKKDKTAITAGLPLVEAKTIFFGSKLTNNPFSLYGSFLFSFQNDAKEILDEVFKLARSRGLKKVEIRTYQRLPAVPGVEEKTIRVIPVMKMEQAYEETASKMKKHFRDNLNSIKKKIDGEKRFLFSLGCNGQDFEDFHAVLLAQCKNKHHAPLAPLEFFKNLRKYFDNSAMRLYLLRFNGRLAAGIIAFIYKDKAYYAWSTSDAEFDHLSVSTFLFDCVVRDLIGLGVRVFELGVTSPENKQLLFFKMRWASEVIKPYFYFYSIYGEKHQDFSSETAFLKERALMRLVPMPIFREANKMFYKYLA